MTDTLRATTVLSGGEPASRTEAALTNTAPPSSGTRPPYNRAAPSKRQVRPASRSKTSSRRAAFAAILKSEQWSNMIRLKNRGFVGNRIAKLVTGHSQALCYQVKNAAISALVKHGGASLLSLEPSSHGPIVGLAFVGGGRLHAKPACLDTHARFTLQNQFAAALQNGNYFSGEARDEGF